MCTNKSVGFTFNTYTPIVIPWVTLLTLDHHGVIHSACSEQTQLRVITICFHLFSQKSWLGRVSVSQCQSFPWGVALPLTALTILAGTSLGRGSLTPGGHSFLWHHVTSNKYTWAVRFQANQFSGQFSLFQQTSKFISLSAAAEHKLASPWHYSYSQLTDPTWLY